MVGVAASIHRLLLGEGSFNNYTIFVNSWKHLVQHASLYASYPDEKVDLYKYSPTFAFLMAPFALLPRWSGLIAWNLLNMLLPVWAISKLNITQKQKNLVLFILFLELLSSIQNAQSNGVMLGLMIGAFALFEKDKVAPAMLLICLGFYIKLFAAVAALMLFFYPKKIKSMTYGAGFVIVLGLLPLIVVPWSELVSQYQNWLHLLQNDPAHRLNFSFMTLIERTLQIEARDIVFLVPGIALLLLPLARLKQTTHFQFRIYYLCSLLIWVVIFNHKAESPTYCIALGGIALWYILSEKTASRNVMMVLAFILVALSPTDLFPRAFREEYIIPYALKALMPVVIWLWVTWDLLQQEFAPPFPSPKKQKA